MDSSNYLHASPIRAKKIVDEILKGGYLKFYDATTDSRLENLEAKKTVGIASILSVPVLEVLVLNSSCLCSEKKSLFASPNQADPG